jgi:hypothetical protein
LPDILDTFKNLELKGVWTMLVPRALEIPVSVFISFKMAQVLGSPALQIIGLPDVPLATANAEPTVNPRFNAHAFTSYSILLRERDRILSGDTPSVLKCHVGIRFFMARFAQSHVPLDFSKSR